MDKKISELNVASVIDGADVSVLVHNNASYQFTFATLLTYIGSNLQLGAGIIFGTVLPQNIAGKNGDVFINTAAGSFAQKANGVWAVVYTLPLNGGGQADGTVLYGLGIPANGTGSNNDTYINTGTGIFYKKTAGAWSPVFTMLNGPAGAKGDKGDKGDTGAGGRTILSGTVNPSNTADGTNGDYYINTSTYQLFGPKTAGVWGSGTSLVGLEGARGDSGNTGPMGAAGHGVPVGGTTGQVLKKVSGTDYDTAWGNGGGGGAVSSLIPKQLTFGKDDGSLAQSADLQFDPTAKAFQIGLSSPFAGGNIYFFGTSITNGTGASTGVKSYPQIAAAALGLTPSVNGVSASTLEKRSPVDITGGQNMVDRISGIPVKTADDRFLIFEFGINDVNYNGDNYTPANFKADYETVIQAALTNGWPADHIVIFSTTYQESARYGQPGTGGTPAISLDRQQAFNQAALQVSQEFGTLYFDVFNYIAGRGDTANLNDGLHPNDTGHFLMAHGLLYTLYPFKAIFGSRYVTPDPGGKLLGVDANQQMGVINVLPDGIKINNPILITGLKQLAAQEPDLLNATDLLLKVNTALTAAFNGNSAWYGRIELLDNTASMNFRVTYNNGKFKFFGGADGNTLLAYINQNSELILGSAETVADQPGDIWQQHSAGLGSSVGGIQGKFIPLENGTNHTVIKNDYSTGKIVHKVSGGTNGAELEALIVNADGTIENPIAGGSIILKSPGGSRFAITVADSGTLTTTAL